MLYCNLNMPLVPRDEERVDNSEEEVSGSATVIKVILSNNSVVDLLNCRLRFIQMPDYLTTFSW